jgi:hypothetical protein
LGVNKGEFYASAVAAYHRSYFHLDFRAAPLKLSTPCRTLKT